MAKYRITFESEFANDIERAIRFWEFFNDINNSDEPPFDINGDDFIYDIEIILKTILHTTRHISTNDGDEQIALNDYSQVTQPSAKDFLKRLFKAFSDTD